MTEGEIAAAKFAMVLDLHRDERGNGLLIGPNCPDCQRREVVTYVCRRCDQEWEIDGKYVWSWQGKGHFHEQDDKDEWHQIIHDHVRSHTPNSIIIPKKMIGGSWDEKANG